MRVLPPLLVRRREEQVVRSRGHPDSCDKAFVRSGFWERPSGAAAAALLFSSIAYAAPGDREAIRVSYRAPAGCPTEARFWDELRARTDRVRRAEGAEPARLFTVVVDARPGASSGALEATDVQGATTRREVTGDDCAEVVSALALIAALAVDSEARTGPAAALTPAAGAETPGNPAGAASAGPGPTASAPAPPPYIEVSPRVPTEPPATAAGPNQKNNSDYRWSIGWYGEALGGVVPSLAFGNVAYVGLGDESAGTFSPEFRLGFVAALTETTFAGQLGAHITWITGRFEACPVRPEIVTKLRLEGCAGIDAGAMRTTGTGVDHPDSEYSAWVAPLALARLEWFFGRWHADLGLGVTVPITRHPFVYDPGNGRAEEVSRIRPAGALVTLGVAYVFP